jgi:hypothetical protein
MLTPIVHDLLAAYATTLGELLRSDPTDARLRALLRREHIDAHNDLYFHLWEYSGGRVELGRLVVAADSEGSVAVFLRSPGSKACRVMESVN